MIPLKKNAAMQMTMLHNLKAVGDSEIQRRSHGPRVWAANLESLKTLLNTSVNHALNIGKPLDKDFGIDGSSLGGSGVPHKGRKNST